jgi:hypothetical protein
MQSQVMKNRISRRLRSHAQVPEADVAKLAIKEVCPLETLTNNAKEKCAAKLLSLVLKWIRLKIDCLSRSTCLRHSSMRLGFIYGKRLVMSEIVSGVKRQRGAAGCKCAKKMCRCVVRSKNA